MFEASARPGASRVETSEIGQVGRRGRRRRARSKSQRGAPSLGPKSDSSNLGLATDNPYHRQPRRLFHLRVTERMKTHTPSARMPAAPTESSPRQRRARPPGRCRRCGGVQRREHWRGATFGFQRRLPVSDHLSAKCQTNLREVGRNRPDFGPDSARSSRFRSKLVKLANNWFELDRIWPEFSQYWPRQFRPNSGATNRISRCRGSGL